MARYRVEIDGATVLDTNSVDEVSLYVAVNRLATAGLIADLPRVRNMALSRDGELICGFIYNNEVQK